MDPCHFLGYLPTILIFYLLFSQVKIFQQRVFEKLYSCANYFFRDVYCVLPRPSRRPWNDSVQIIVWEIDWENRNGGKGLFDILLFSFWLKTVQFIRFSSQVVIPETDNGNISKVSVENAFEEYCAQRLITLKIVDWNYLLQVFFPNFSLGMKISRVLWDWGLKFPLLFSFGLHQSLSE